MVVELIWTQRLEIDGQTLTVPCTTYLGIGPNAKGPTPVVKPRTDFVFQIETTELGETFRAAIERARRLSKMTATIDGIDARELWLKSADLRFGPDGDEREGKLFFHANLSEPFVLPFDLGDAELVSALRAAALKLGLAIRADAITVLDRYYIFRVYEIGTLGAFIDRRSGHVAIMGSGVPEQLWMWGHERHLLDEPAGDVIVEAVSDLSRAMKLQRFARVGAEDLKQLPLVLAGCATWSAILPLHEAGDGLIWSVRPA